MDQKRLDEVKRVRSALEAGKSLLTEAERDTITECTRELDVVWETLETCFNCPQKYIAEALGPIVKYKRYKVC